MCFVKPFLCITQFKYGVVAAYGVRLKVALDSVQVVCQSGQSRTSVSLVEIPDRTEIGDLLSDGGSASFASGQRSSLIGGQIS